MTAAAARRSPREELPAVVGFQQYARFESIDPSTNRERFYPLAVQTNLFGDISLVRTWGRIGTNGHSLAGVFPDRQSAQPVVERLIRRPRQRPTQLEHNLGATSGK
jgi:predicted DNA-binding WGR domain protein